MFPGNTPTAFKELREAIAKENSKTINFLAHKLAGRQPPWGPQVFWRQSGFGKIPPNKEILRASPSY
jgi:hypothetical protein